MSVVSTVRRVATSAMVTGALLASSAVVAQAQTTFSGTGGNVSVRFLSFQASDRSILSYKIGNGAFNNGAYTDLFINNGAGATPVGSEADIGPVAAGTEVFFRIKNTTLGGLTFYNGPGSRNGDNGIHATSQPGSNAPAVGGGTYNLRFDFEDLTVPSVYTDYNDLSYEVAGVTTSVVPEPSTYVLMASGLLALGVAARRRRKV